MGKNYNGPSLFIARRLVKAKDAIFVWDGTKSSLHNNKPLLRELSYNPDMAIIQTNDKREVELPRYLEKVPCFYIDLEKVRARFD